MNPTVWLGQHNPYLIDVENGHTLHQQVVPAFTQMQKAASNEGIDLRIVSSYRSFERQMLIWNKKWRGETTLLDEHGQPLNSSTLSEEEKLHAILTWSALPGGSRHHWGTDFDVFDKTAVAHWQGDFSLVDSEYRENGPCFALATWLKHNMTSFGFHRPFDQNTGGVACELWHLSHTASAKEFEHARQLPPLVETIENTDIAGKTVILKHIEEIYHRYIMNRGEGWDLS